MLIEFTVGNFRSFRETSTFSFVASRLKSSDQLDGETRVSVTNDLTLLRSAAVYGANASGKSNFVKALAFVRKFVLESSKEGQVDERIPVEPFRLATQTRDRPSLFEVVFVERGIQYRYGFEVTSTHITREWLHYVPQERETRLFMREGQNVELNRSAFKEGRGLDSKTRPNALFLSVCAQFNGEVSRSVLTWFRKLRVIAGVIDLPLLDFTVEEIAEGEHRQEILRLLTGFDLGISSFDVRRTKRTEEQLPKDMPVELRSFILKHNSEVSEVFTEHQVFDAEGRVAGNEFFNLEQHESDGTQRLFALSGPLVDTLNRGYVLVVDELGSRLHSLLTQAIVRLFHSPTVNKGNAQLLFTTHDMSLLTPKTFRRDQVWFTEKSPTAATEMYSLAEFKVRRDAQFSSEYLLGRFGAIPTIVDLAALWSTDA